LAIGTIIISIGKIYYDAKQAAGFGSVAKLVKASKILKEMKKNGCLVRTRTLYINM